MEKHHRYYGCIHYGTQFEREVEKEKRDEREFDYPPLYMRLRRHRIGRRYHWHY